MIGCIWYELISYQGFSSESTNKELDLISSVRYYISNRNIHLPERVSMSRVSLARTDILLVMGNWSIVNVNPCYFKTYKTYVYRHMLRSPSLFIGLTDPVP